MVAKRRTQKVPARLSLVGELTIYAVAERKPEILSLLAEDEAEIDLSGVTEVDGAGLQLLMLAKREALTRGKALRLTGHPPAVLEVLELTHLTGAFGDPVILPR